MSNFSAVLVGINNYPGGNQLRGCVSDVIIAQQILTQRHRVDNSDIRMVLDERATRDEIVARLEWLVGNDNPEKLFYYSGHGAQIPVQNYSAPHQPPNGMDSLICPVDFDWNGTYIMDTQIGDILSKLKEGHHMSMVFDSCYSGLIVDREIIGRNFNSDRAKCISTPLDLLSRMPGVSLTGVSLDPATFATGGAFTGAPKQAVTMNPIGGTYSQFNVAILTGCKSNQTSADANVGNRFQGALSFVMQGIILEQPTIDLKTLRDLCEAKLKQLGYEQTPQLICKKATEGQAFIRV